MLTCSMRRWAGWCLLVIGGARGVAQIEIAPAIIDLGRVDQHQTFERTVTLTNTGRAPLDILATRADCACTAVTPKLKRLAPGQSTPVTVLAESRSFQGDMAHRVVVQTTAGEAALTVRMNVAPLGDWNIGAFPVLFPQSALALETSVGVRLSYAGEGSVALLEATADVPWLDATIASAGRPNAYELRLTKRPVAPSGLLSATVRVKTSSGKHPVLTIPVMVPVTSTPRLTPNPVVLPTVRVGEASSGGFRIVGWTGRNPPAARVAEGKITAEGVSNGAYSFTLKLQATKPGVQIRTLYVYDGPLEQIEVPVILRAEP